MTESEFFEGYSVPRNKELMRIFRDLADAKLDHKEQAKKDLKSDSYKLRSTENAIIGWQNEIFGNSQNLKTEK